MTQIKFGCILVFIFSVGCASKKPVYQEEIFVSQNSQSQTQQHRLGTMQFSNASFGNPIVASNNQCDCSEFQKPKDQCDGNDTNYTTSEEDEFSLHDSSCTNNNLINSPLPHYMQNDCDRACS